MSAVPFSQAGVRRAQYAKCRCEDGQTQRFAAFPLASALARASARPGTAASLATPADLLRSRPAPVPAFERQPAAPGHQEPPNRLAPAQSLPGLALQPAALTLRQASPDAEPLIMLERVFEALRPDLAAAAHPLGFPGGTALLREERLGIGLRAQGPVLPAQFPGIILAHAETVVHQREDDVSHSAPPPLPETPSARAPLPRARELHG